MLSNRAGNQKLSVALWTDIGVHVEVWIEKDALADVIVDVARTFDVPLMVAWAASNRWRRRGTRSRAAT